MTPNEVLSAPDVHAREYLRVQTADLSFPIEVFQRRDKLMILDGIHRLARALSQGRDSIDVRFVPAAAVRRL